MTIVTNPVAQAGIFYIPNIEYLPKVDRMNIDRFSADLLKALAHPARLGILNVLQADGESCVCHLEHSLGYRQAYLSQQLARLRETGLVQDRREGLNVFYAIAHSELYPLLETIRSSCRLIAERSAVHLDYARSSRKAIPQCPCPHCQVQQPTTPVLAGRTGEA
jgi:DNA-binding transcriptional ArsR family regulator